MSLMSTSAPSTSADATYRIMRKRIMMAEWQPGERLVHRQLAKQFGASNIPVLEALRRLESEGLVTSFPHAGAQVKVWNESDIRGAFLAREALEGVACRLFTEQASAGEKAKVRDYAHQFDQACKAGDYQAACEADIQIHLYIAGNYNLTARSAALFRLVENACLLAITIRSFSQAQPLPLEEIGPVGVHDELVSALNSDDPDLAERTGKLHVRTSMEEVLESFNTSERNKFAGRDKF